MKVRIAPEKLERLPKWVQEHITRLESELGRAERHIADLTLENQERYGKKVFFEDRFNKRRVYLPSDRTISFALGEHWLKHIGVRIEDDHLIISGGNAISVHPRSGNLIWVKGENFF